MPRQPATARSFTVSASTRASIKPPDDLNALEKQAFVDVVMGSPPNHFLPADITEISQYARAVVAEKIADGELSACPVTADNKPSPWLPVWLARLRACTTLARRLRLNPAGRSPFEPLPDNKQEPHPVSHYAKMALEARRDDAKN